MKYFIYLFFIAILSSCGAKQDLIHGRYDVAIEKSVRKIRKNPNKIKYLDILEQAFNQAQQQDLNKINYLKREGTPENWDAIFQSYSNIKRRQDLVKTVPNLPANISFVNVDEDLIKAKQNAAEYYYSHAQKLMQQGGRQNARNAYLELQKTKNYYTNFKDVDQLISKARFQGTTFIYFKMENNSNMIMPKNFESEILKFTPSGLDDQWTVFHSNAQSDINYNFIIAFKLNQIDVSPEKMFESQYVDKDTIEDGLRYVYDSRGNVKKDTAGNDIKVKAYKAIMCNVIENKQSKVARIGGVLEIYSNETKQLLKSDPVITDAVFEHFSAVAQGDLRALSATSRKKIKSQPLPFPSNADLIMMGTNNIKGIVSNIINSNKYLFQ